jgi:hypothetical protein
MLWAVKGYSPVTVLGEHVYVSRWDADRTPIYTVDLSRVVGG